MDHAEGRVTVFHRVNNNPYCKKIVNLVYRLILINHLFVDTEEMLDSSIDFRPDMGIFHML